MSPLVALVALALPAEIGEVTFRPSPAEAVVPEPFRLAGATFAFEMEMRRDESRFTVSTVRFPSPVITIDPDNNTVHAEYFRPKIAGKRPAVVVLHILGADFALSRYMATRLADRGVAALFVKLPYYGERRGKDGSKKFLSTDIERSVVAMRQGVCDVRRAATWLASRDEVDPARLGVAGISLGGIVASLSASVDPTLNRAALILAGGGLGEILWEMPEAAKYRAMWIASGRTREDLANLVRPFDPLTYAEGLRGKTVFMVAGKTDEVIPSSAARALWEKAGQPPIRWLECGHYSAAGFMLPTLREMVDFFADDREARELLPDNPNIPRPGGLPPAIPPR